LAILKIHLSDLIGIRLRDYCRAHKTAQAKIDLEFGLYSDSFASGYELEKPQKKASYIYRDTLLSGHRMAVYDAFYL
jgi:hypothetical protein